jgi:hypothetical protein
MAFNGTGSNVTSLNASNVASGTLAVARGGTGTASPSLVAGSGISVSGTWPNQTVATSGGGGVTSLNGQTGAITNTDYGAIGSVVKAANTTSSSYLPGATIAGSSLYYPNTFSQAVANILYSQGNNSSTSFTYWAVAETGRQNSGNTGYQFPAGAATLSGTWRAMYFANLRQSQFQPCDNVTFSNSFVSVWVRIS